jgi:predicted SAM-dependent methyltransferase
MEESRIATAMQRLNWGCGEHPPPGWINVDKIERPGIAISGDIRDGLPLPAGSIDYVVSIHAVQDLPYLDVVPALREFRRVLKSGGVLRLGLPDLDEAIHAYLGNDPDYFYVPDHESVTLSGKLIIQMTWYGWSRMMFTYEFAEELLRKAGFASIRRCAFRETHAPFPEIVELDNRERESFFVEAVKGDD